MPPDPLQRADSDSRAHADTEQASLTGHDPGDGDTPSRSQQALIRTLTLSRGNYGGIMQAYALQRALDTLGVSAFTDTSERLSPLVAIRRASLALASKLLRRPVGYWQKMRHQNAEVDRFVRREIATVKLFRLGMFQRRSILRGADLLVTGSDQVWRPEYGDVGSYLFDFAMLRADQILISYAASFGTDSPPESLRHLSVFAKRMAAASVREESAVTLARDLWDLEATRVPDPTFLLPREHYETLCDGVRSSSRPRVFAYLLDSSTEKRRIVDAVATAVAQVPIGSDAGARVETRIISDHGGVKVRVDAWLTEFRDADSVVTDSFHGCVFAIIFGKPFVAIANHERGLTRFTALLERFDLLDRLCVVDAQFPVEEAARQIASRHVDWSLVATRVAEERQLGLDFLRRTAALQRRKA